MALRAGLEPVRINGPEILSSLHYSTRQDNPPKHKSNARPFLVKVRLDALILNYERWQSVSEILPSRVGLIAVVIARVTAKIH